MKSAGGKGWEKRRGWSWTTLQRGMPETANALLLRSSRDVDSSSPTMIRLSARPFGFTQVVAFLFMGYIKPAWSWETI